MSDEIEIIDSVDEIDRSGNTDIAVADQEDFDIEIVGRPSKLTDDTVRKLSSGLKMGLSQKKAADFAGISETTFYRWQREFQKIDKACLGNPDRINNADDLNLWEFWQSLKKAKIEGELSHIAVITEAANNGVWQASAWFLERSNPQDWGKDKRELEAHSEGKTIEFNIKYSS
jgi:hypothetical protein